MLKLVTSEAAAVTDYTGHRPTLLFVQEINLINHIIQHIRAGEPRPCQWLVSPDGTVLSHAASL